MEDDFSIQALHLADGLIKYQRVKWVLRYFCVLFTIITLQAEGEDEPGAVSVPASVSITLVAPSNVLTPETQVLFTVLVTPFSGSHFLEHLPFPHFL